MSETINYDQGIPVDQPQVTLRGTIAGLAIGTLILLSNFQFGLQTGWVSMMSLPAALLGYSIFKIIDSYDKLVLPFTPQENVFVQSVAVAVATGPLAYGFIGIIPAIEKLLTPEESGLLDELSNKFHLLANELPFFTPWWKLIIWSLGLGFFGVFFAVILREEFIIKQNLKFPSGSATATLISVFHNFPLRVSKNTIKTINLDNNDDNILSHANVLNSNSSNNNNNGINNNCNVNDENVDENLSLICTHSFNEPLIPKIPEVESYSRDITILLLTALFASIYTLTSYFIPQIRTIPIFGTYISNEYLINFSPSPAYIGQGIIMGFETTFGMFIGMILGWFILSPFVKKIGWAPGETSDWKNGSEGWIMWISLAIMIADSLVSLGLMSYSSFISFYYNVNVKNDRKNLEVVDEDSSLQNDNSSYSSTENIPPNSLSSNESDSNKRHLTYFKQDVSVDTKNETNIDDDEAINFYVPTVGILLLCPVLIFSIRFIFGSIVPTWLLLLTVSISLILSLIGVKSLGETDLNPVSGIGKLSQLLTALVIPASTPGAVLINLIVGAISEATAQQAGDLMQDLKTGYLLKGSAKAQFIGQIFGSIWGVLIAAPMYKWYNKIYEIPGPVFKIPTAVIWIDCARLVNGHELPLNVDKFVIVFGILFIVLSLLKGLQTWKICRFIPSGIAVGIGIYNTPSFTFARFLGGIISWYWMKRFKDKITSLKNPNYDLILENAKVTLIIFSSGLVLGEGLFSVVNMVLASFSVPHL